MSQICETEKAARTVETLQKIKETRPEIVIVDELITIFSANDKDTLNELINSKPDEWDIFANFVDSDEFQKLKEGMRTS